MNVDRASIPLHFKTLLEKLRLLLLQIRKGKEEALLSFPTVISFLSNHPEYHSVLKNLKEGDRILLLSLVAIEQVERVFPDTPKGEELENFFSQLRETEKFYASIGGLIGYYFEILSALVEEENAEKIEEEYFVPPMEDLSTRGAKVDEMVAKGIAHLDELAELYPVGGAADRLRFVKKEGERPLPAACLPLGGVSLLSGLIRDVQARESLYFNIYGKQVTIPIAMMTSDEKDNHQQVMAILEENHWFGRGKDHVMLFRQPLVPIVDQHGHFVFCEGRQLLCKPGGHGVIWKLAQESQVFDWLYQKGKKKLLVRQINNPIAGSDSTLLAFTGVGFARDAQFGFASCPALPGAAEGIDVLKLSKGDFGYRVTISNVEYCDVKKRDRIANVENLPANTNILFADIQGIEKAVRSCLLPGKLVNFKKSAYIDELGNQKELVIGRLETMMQNIADVFATEFKERPTEQELSTLPVFLTYNERCKTISTVKKAEKTKGDLETPSACFSDVLHNNCALLRDHCKIDLPNTENLSVESPPFLLFYHPALGPLYSIIGQKIQRGKWSQASEVQLEISTLFMHDVTVDGSLHIIATDPLGHVDSAGKQLYSDNGGKCFLENVTIANRGVDQEADNNYWQNQINHKEICTIFIEGNGEFYAKGVTLHGDIQITVPSGKRVTAVENHGNVTFVEQEIERPSWKWRYKNRENQIVLEKVELK